jgi:predicted KAP-like P-loop ATPase
LLTEKSVYMTKCKRIREVLGTHEDTASNRGISKKLLRTIIKERAFERKINDLHDILEPDEQSELEMLTEKLGDFANRPLGGAAIAKATGADTLASVGA